MFGKEISIIMASNMIECCANCKHCMPIPRNNSYGDIDYFCMVNSYYLHGINKDRNKVKHFSPGGKELKCKYERKK